MLVFPLALAPIAFAGGLYLVARFAPALAPTRTGRLAGRVVDVLGGLAAVAVVLNAYEVIRTATTDTYGGFDADVPVAHGLVELVFEGGLLIAAAIAVHLLAPPAEEERDWGD